MTDAPHSYLSPPEEISTTCPDDNAQYRSNFLTRARMVRAQQRPRVQLPLKFKIPMTVPKVPPRTFSNGGAPQRLAYTRLKPLRRTRPRLPRADVNPSSRYLALIHSVHCAMKEAGELGPPLRCLSTQQCD